MALKCVRIGDIRQDLHREWWQLYEAAFPLAERRNLEQHAAAMRDEAFRVLHLSDESGFVGLLSYWQWDQLVYVEHLAITPSRRGQGMGHCVLALLDDVRAILEIEPVVDTVTTRRLAFYESCGFTKLPQSHMQLAYQAGQPDVPLWLLSRPEMDATEVAHFEQLFAAGPMRYRDEA